MIDININVSWRRTSNVSIDETIVSRFNTYRLFLMNASGPNQLRENNQLSVNTFQLQLTVGKKSIVANIGKYAVCSTHTSLQQPSALSNTGKKTTTKTVF